jgi:GNAT superfamily N-acetyltransferase
MAVLLKNLGARRPQEEDLNAISALITLCERHSANMLVDVQARWQEPTFHLGEDAWVIVTKEGHLVGFACVWHDTDAEISLYLCVHPAFRDRGIGTLLLRQAEMRARIIGAQARPGERVVLRGLVSADNMCANRFFAREGYLPGTESLRVVFTVTKATGPLSTDRDGLCEVHLYRTYEKVLRTASDECARIENTELVEV